MLMTQCATILGALLALAAAVPADAQPRIDLSTRDALAWSHPHAADVLSTWTVVAAVATPCLQNRHWSCVRREGGRVAAAAGLAVFVKLLVQRERPDGSGDDSFYSMHTSIACAASLGLKTWPLCPAVGYLRIAADKHWLTDVGTGAGVGVGLVKVRF
jgi:membrane-associated phospholipid phosphatase